MDIFRIILEVIGAAGVLYSIYQFAVIRGHEKHEQKMQYLISSIYALASGKQLEWDNQLRIYNPNETDLEIIRLICRARDEFAQIATSTAALEGAIVSGKSAIIDNTKKTLEQVKANNATQEEFLNKPSFEAGELKIDEN